MELTFRMQIHLKKIDVSQLHDLRDISILTLTKDRRPFMALAKYCYLLQTYPEDKMEWVIVDDSNDNGKTLQIIKNIASIKFDFLGAASGDSGIGLASRSVGLLRCPFLCDGGAVGTSSAEKALVGLDGFCVLSLAGCEGVGSRFVSHRCGLARPSGKRC